MSAPRPSTGKLVAMRVPYGAHAEGSVIAWPVKWSTEVIAGLRANLDQIERELAPETPS